jgi:transcriptional regulator with XRE-family HTH domain
MESPGSAPIPARSALTRMAGSPDRHQSSASAWGNHRPSTPMSPAITLHGIARVGRAERRLSVKRSPYGERDYAFGQLMLTLRMGIGLTQAGLAQRLGVSRHTVGEWEGGLSYPKADHLKAFVALGMGASVFAAGREEEEIRALWHAAHQKVFINEAWLRGLLSQTTHQLTLVADASVEPVVVEPAWEPRVDWDDALSVPNFYGRVWELTMLSKWVVQERCRVVSLLGLGGIGKSALAVHLMHKVAPHFEVVIWRSLRDAPTCEAVLDQCLQVLAPQSLGVVPTSLERRLDLLLEHL